VCLLLTLVLLIGVTFEVVIVLATVLVETVVVAVFGHLLKRILTV
jgi:hypothetical protein